MQVADTIVKMVQDEQQVEEEQVGRGGKAIGPFTGQTIKAVLGNDEFALNEHGLFHVAIEEDRINPIMQVCAPLKIIADTRDVNGENWGRILEFRDKDGKLQQYTMKMQDLRRDGDEVVDVLLSRGLSIAPGKKPRLRLVEYVQNSQPENNTKARSTDMTGWHDKQFVLSNEIIGEGKERILYHGRQPNAKTYEQKGTLEEWQENIARLCVGNSRLILALATAFAAPILRLVGMEGGGVHFVGTSSTGKSTALYVAASVMGNPEHYNQSWRATGNGLEGIAKFHNDTCLIIDEMGQVQAKEAGEISYMLANGSGKLRANIKGEARDKASWRLLFLSSGEVTLAEHMNEGGKKARAGMEIRLVDIQADAGEGMGIFEDIHGYGNGAEFSDMLKSCATDYHGVPFREFVKRLIGEEDLIQASIGELQEDFLETQIPKHASGQVRRVAARFALIAAAGELATRYGITGWQVGEATTAAATCFQSWFDIRGGDGNQETKKLLEQVRSYFAKNGDTRFVEVQFVTGFKVVDENQKVLNRAGFRIADKQGRTEFLVLPAAFHEICEGFNIRTAAKTLIEKGVLTPEREGKSQKLRRMPGMGPTRIYHINGNIWEE
jgi:putative DNA primase/helicase